MLNTLSSQGQQWKVIKNFVPILNLNLFLNFQVNKNRNHALLKITKSKLNLIETLHSFDNSLTKLQMEKKKTSVSYYVSFKQNTVVHNFSIIIILDDVEESISIGILN